MAMSEAELRHRAQMSAYRMTLSPWEWTWDHTEQKEMATLILMQNDEIEKLRKVAEAAKDLEDFSPTPNTYVGGQSAWSQTRHSKALAVKKALKEAGFGDE